MPRAIWTGAISFGLVNVPVRLYSAIDTTDLEFTLLHAKDDGPIGYRKVCKEDDKAVPDDEIVKGYEVAKGKYVHVTDEDFAAAEVEGYRTIAIEEFVAVRGHRPDLLRADVLPRAAGRRGARVRAAAPRDGGLRARGHRHGTSCETASTSAASASARA